MTKEQDLGDDISNGRRLDFILRSGEIERLENTELAKAVDRTMAVLFNSPRVPIDVKTTLKDAAERAKIIGGSSTEAFSFHLEATVAESLVSAVGVIMNDPEAPVTEIKDYLLKHAGERAVSLRARGELEAARQYECALRGLGVVSGDNQELADYPGEYEVAGELAATLETYLNHPGTYPAVIDTFLDMVEHLENSSQYYPDPFEPVSHFASLSDIRLARKEAYDIRALRYSSDVPETVKEHLRRMGEELKAERQEAGKHGEAWYYSLATVVDLNRTSW